ncbi:tetratricopeptide repeat protein, partial [Pseudomonadota bacterium]
AAKDGDVLSNIILAEQYSNYYADDELMKKYEAKAKQLAAEYIDRLIQQASYDDHAKFYLALMYRIGLGVSEDMNKASGMLSSLAENGMVYAQDTIAWDYIYPSDESKPDYEKALQWFERAARNGYAPGWYGMGHVYSGDVDDKQKDYEKAVIYYRKAAELGMPAAQYELATLLSKHIDTAGDPDQVVIESTNWALKSAKAGYAAAITEVNKTRKKLMKQILKPVDERMMKLKPETWDELVFLLRVK